MTVQELIEKLEQLPQHYEVSALRIKEKNYYSLPVVKVVDYENETVNSIIIN